ncbi:MAG: choice-of-anchor D domain-containing protein, partial [Chitinophagia bacterium]|nr:choice-of-anchor D domain-containing protein [Chitinophagia bacterium]
KAAAAGLVDKDLGTLNVVVSGGVYDYAQADFSAATLAFGNVRKGTGSLTRSVAVTNTLFTNAGFQDSLDVTGAVTNGKLAVSLPVNAAAGATGDVTVTASTASAGALADTLGLAFFSNANGVAGLTGQALTGGAVAITGAVYDLANAAVAPALAFGNVRTGTVRAVGVSNAAITAAAYQDSLDVTATTGNARLALTNPANIAADATGAVTVRAATAGSLAGTITASLDVAAATANGNLTLIDPANILAGAAGNVGVKAKLAGSLDATVALTLTSNANAVADLVNVGLAGQSIAVTGAAYDYAQSAVTNRVLAFGNVRKGDVLADQTLAFVNTLTTDAAFQDSLRVATTANNAKLTATGALVAANTSGDLVVTASTASAGTLADLLAVTQTSKAAAAGLVDKDLGTLNVVVSGGVYDYAQADFSA